MSTHASTPLTAAPAMGTDPRRSPPLSADPYHWAWRQLAPTPTAQVVLIALGWHAMAVGSDRCAPSLRRLAVTCELTPEQVAEALTALADAHLIAIEVVPEQGLVYRLGPAEVRDE